MSAILVCKKIHCLTAIAHCNEHAINHMDINMHGTYSYMTYCWHAWTSKRCRHICFSDLILQDTLHDACVANMVLLAFWLKHGIHWLVPFRRNVWYPWFCIVQSKRFLSLTCDLISETRLSSFTSDVNSCLFFSLENFAIRCHWWIQDLRFSIFYCHRFLFWNVYLLNILVSLCSPKIHCWSLQLLLLLTGCFHQWETDANSLSEGTSTRL